MRDAGSRFATSARCSGVSRSLPGGSWVERHPRPRFRGSGAVCSRRRATRLGLAALLATAALALTATPASALYAHTETTAEFGKEGPKATGLGNGCSIAYQIATHKLYLFSDEKIYGLERTSPGTVVPLGGAFPISTGLNSSCGDRGMAVDNSATASAGNIYAVPSSHSIYGWTAEGLTNEPWTNGVDAGGETCGVAVSNTGEVFGGTYGGGKVTRFTSGGGENGSISPGLGSNCKVAIDQSNNDLYITKYNFTGTVYKLAAPGYSSVAVEFPNASYNNGIVAINGERHRLYTPRNSEIKVFDTTTGAQVETITIPGNARAIAIDEPTDTLFVADTSTGVIREIPGANVPIVTTEEPVGNTTVSGKVELDGAGNIEECDFEFGTSPSNLSSSQACDQATPLTTDQTVTATLPGLEGEKTYYYRLHAKNGNLGGGNYGAAKTITPHNVKGLLTEEATGVTRTSGELHASFEGNGEETTYYFEWGIGGYEYQSSAPPGESVGSPTYPPRTFLEFTPTGLQPDTTYRFRVVAENGLGKSPGAQKTFKTLPAVQSLTTLPAAGIGAKKATLNGSYEGDGDATSYYFEYGKTASYGFKTTETSAGSPSGSTPLSAEVTELLLDTEYHYRVVATNSLGTTKGADETFHTNPAVAGVTAIPPGEEDLTLEAVTIRGEFTGNGEDTKCFFEYGQTTKYGKSTPEQDLGTEAGPVPASAILTDHEAYSLYHFRLVCENSQGVTKSPDMTFETLPAPLPAISGTTASEITSTGATMKAEINPERWLTVFAFEYGPTAEYGESTEIGEPIGSDQFTHPVSQVVTGLEPGTNYHYRVVAINFTGTAYGPDMQLTTPGPPRIDSTSSSAVGETTAHLRVVLSPKASSTTVRFEYGTSTAYGASTGEIPVGSDVASHEVGADVSGLAPGTTYHFHAVATNGVGITVGSDQTLTTAPAPIVQPKPKPKHCRKGYVRKHGKCRKKHHRKKHHRKKHHRHSNRRHG